MLGVTVTKVPTPLVQLLRAGLQPSKSDVTQADGAGAGAGVVAGRTMVETTVLWGGQLVTEGPQLVTVIYWVEYEVLVIAAAGSAAAAALRAKPSWA